MKTTAFLTLIAFAVFPLSSCIEETWGEGAIEYQNTSEHQVAIVAKLNPNYSMPDSLVLEPFATHTLVSGDWPSTGYPRSLITEGDVKIYYDNTLCEVFSKADQARHPGVGVNFTTTRSEGKSGDRVVSTYTFTEDDYQRVLAAWQEEQEGED